MKAGQIIRCTKMGNEEALHVNKLHEGKMMVLEKVQYIDVLGVCTGENRYWEAQNIIQLVNDGYEFELINNGQVIEKFNNMLNDPWEPKNGETAACISMEGKVRFYVHNGPEQFYYNEREGNVFKTEEVAENESKRESLMRIMRNFARSNGGPGAYTINYDLRNGELKYMFMAPLTNFGSVSFKDMKTVEAAILRYGDEIKSICELDIKEETE